MTALVGVIGAVAYKLISAHNNESLEDDLLFEDEEEEIADSLEELFEKSDEEESESILEAE